MLLSSQHANVPLSTCCSHVIHPHRASQRPHPQLSASLDGSVRAFDLVRYRNFRTLTAPSAAQFISLAVDAAGEVVAAGAQEPFSIFVWSLKTGRLLDVLEGHQGPVCGLAFNPALPMLLSCSWDRTLKTWDVFGGKVSKSLVHSVHVFLLFLLVFDLLLSFTSCLSVVSPVLRLAAIVAHERGRTKHMFDCIHMCMEGYPCARQQ